jgi:hypothetical protein
MYEASGLILLYYKHRGNQLVRHIYSSRRPLSGVPVLTGILSSALAALKPAAAAAFCSDVDFFFWRGLSNRKAISDLHI